MSSTVALQAMFDRFVERFVLPLVAGGEVLVSFPFGAGAAEHFALAEPSDPDVLPALLRARDAVLRDLTLAPDVGPLTEEERGLLMALHNVLLAAHGELAEGFRGEARWRLTLRWGLEQLARVRPCDSPVLALARHSLLHRAPELTRRDVELSTRFGGRQYRGQDPPAMALVWPRLRRVETRESRAGLRDIVPGEDARRALTALLELSPLTCLLAMPYSDAPGVHTAPLRFSAPVVSTLSMPSLCRAVTYRHLELGFDRVGQPLADGVLSWLDRAASAGPRSADTLRLAFGLRYIVNLQLTHCWTEADPEALLAPLAAEWDKDADAARRFFFGWAAAALARSDRVGAPEPSDPELAERERRYQVEAAEVAGPALEDAARQVDWLAPPAQEPKPHQEV